MLALVVTVPAGEAELAADALWSLGVLAVEERDHEAGTEDHLVELWTSLGDDVDAVTAAAVAFPARWRWRLVDVDESVSETWRRHVTPTWVSADLVICPAWIDLPAHTGATVVRIEPGASFGLGDHASTVLSLRALRASLFKGAVVLDVGCGSGVLSIAACLLGAARAEAIDISPAAITATVDNASRNGVVGQVAASTTPLADVDGQFDVVVANILAPALIELSGDLRRVLAPSGVLVVSGVLAERHDHVLATLAPLQTIASAELDGWAAITLRR